MRLENTDRPEPPQAKENHRKSLADKTNRPDRQNPPQKHSCLGRFLGLASALLISAANIGPCNFNEKTNAGTVKESPDTSSHNSSSKKAAVPNASKHRTREQSDVSPEDSAKVPRDIENPAPSVHLPGEDAEPDRFMHLIKLRICVEAVGVVCDTDDDPLTITCMDPVDGGIPVIVKDRVYSDTERTGMIFSLGPEVKFHPIDPEDERESREKELKDLCMEIRKQATRKVDRTVLCGNMGPDACDKYIDSLEKENTIEEERRMVADLMDLINEYEDGLECEDGLSFGCTVDKRGDYMVVYFDSDRQDIHIKIKKDLSNKHRKRADVEVNADADPDADFLTDKVSLSYEVFYIGGDTQEYSDVNDVLEFLLEMSGE